ncbi:LuxR C-terminal-related transcriptional regulator [Macrococcus sp. DPC7161]|uniref:LuxR C-terminal-related transcriptional regulator n=1 Tax=Macrococcus sp. DPC7161 TaxID=2507060 RepID=UPI00100AFB8C|nr:LuxR C-terminal-related transcriptional regulator [Macrococcus sp. DPC7161]RXK18788.1 hypothetical protein ER639_00325 [Macrococcus sp. DPC7161]
MFEKLLEEYQRYIHYLIQKYHLSYEKDEYFQKLSIKLWELNQQFDASKQNKQKYLMTKLNFYLIDELRKQIKYQERNVYDETLLMYQKIEDDASHLLIEHIKSQLTAKENDLLEKLILGYMIKEIAQEQQVSVSCIKQQKKRLKEKIEHIIK